MSGYGQSENVIGLFTSSKITRDQSVSDGNASDVGIRPHAKLRTSETPDEAGAPDKQNVRCHRSIRFVIAPVSLPNGG
jgi:hypothetical protein